MKNPEERIDQTYTLLRGIDVLRACGIPNGMIMHSLKVRDAVLMIGGMLQLPEYDFESVVVAALLHDIGRSRSSGVDHGLRGAEILQSHGFREDVCQMLRCHVGVGLTQDECEKLNVQPAGDYLPQTTCQRLLCLIDNLYSGGRLLNLEESLEKFRLAGLSENHLQRQRELYESFNEQLRSIHKDPRLDLYQLLRHIPAKV